MHFQSSNLFLCSPCTYLYLHFLCRHNIFCTPISFSLCTTCCIHAWYDCTCVWYDRPGQNGKQFFLLYLGARDNNIYDTLAGPIGITSDSLQCVQLHTLLLSYVLYCYWKHFVWIGRMSVYWQERTIALNYGYFSCRFWTVGPGSRKQWRRCTLSIDESVLDLELLYLEKSII